VVGVRHRAPKFKAGAPKYAIDLANAVARNEERQRRARKHLGRLANDDPALAGRQRPSALPLRLLSPLACSGLRHYHRVCLSGFEEDGIVGVDAELAEAQTVEGGHAALSAFASTPTSRVLRRLWLVTHSARSAGA
jgi:hypothetical protein